MADANGSNGKSGKNFGKLGVPALIAGAALLVPFAYARIASASTKGKPPRLARAMPGKGKRQPPTVMEPEPERAPPARAPAPAAEADAPPVVAPEPALAAPQAPATPPAEPAAAIVKPDPVPAPPAPLPVAVPLEKPEVTTAEKLSPLQDWLRNNATAKQREDIDAKIPRTTTALSKEDAAMALCNAVVQTLPGELLDKLEDDYPAIKPELAVCERAKPPTTAPAPTVPEIPPAPAPPVVDVSTPTTPAAAPPTPAPAPAPPVVAPSTPAPEPAPAPEAAPPPAPPDPVPAPPAPPPVVSTAPEAPAVVATPPAAAQLATPKPPAGFDAAKARELAPKLAKSVADKKYDYSRRTAKAFQIAAGIEPDKFYGGETRSAVEAFGVRRAPKALFKPTGSVAYKWADYV